MSGVEMSRMLAEMQRLCGDGGRAAERGHARVARLR